MPKTILLLIWLLSATALSAQNITFEQSMQLLRGENTTIKIAHKEVEWAQAERARLNAFWYPSLAATGAYVYMSNPIEVKEPLNQFTNPAKDYVHSIIPDDVIISSILDKIGSYTLRFPLAPQSITTIDANLTFPLFVGGKRIYASRIGKSMVKAAEISGKQVDGDMQILLVESYYGLRLARRVVEVRRQTYASLEKHYRDAVKLEAQGMIDKAARLFVQVNKDEARREVDAAIKDMEVAQSALKTLLKIESTEVLNPVSSIFINESLPQKQYFKSLIGQNSPIINRLETQSEIAQNQTRIARSEYMPNIALMGKQTLYAHGIEKNLLPRSMVGVGLTWNLFDGLAREKRIRQAKIASQTLELAHTKAMDDITLGVDKFYAEAQNALSGVKALDSTIELSRELVRMRKKAFAEGMATSSEVVDAEVMLSKVQIASLLAYYQYDIALINLLNLCGTAEEFVTYSNRGITEHYIFK